MGVSFLLYRFQGLTRAENWGMFNILSRDTQKLLPLVGNVFSIYDLSDDNFALSSDYDLLYTELTGATVLYLDEYGV